jgi:hypothetical protein
MLDNLDNISKVVFARCIHPLPNEPNHLYQSLELWIYQKPFCFKMQLVLRIYRKATSFREYPYFVAIKSKFLEEQSAQKQHRVPLAKQNRQFP